MADCQYHVDNIAKENGSGNERGDPRLNSSNALVGGANSSRFIAVFRSIACHIGDGFEFQASTHHACFYWCFAIVPVADDMLHRLSGRNAAQLMIYLSPRTRVACSVYKHFPNLCSPHQPVGEGGGTPKNLRLNLHWSSPNGWLRAGGYNPHAFATGFTRT